jgi:hypothetical protein
MEEEFINDLNEYYKLKSKYEEENNKIKKQIINNTKLSFKEKQYQYKQIKQKCINCKRPGGTIFSTKYYEDTSSSKTGDLKQFRQLKALCGVEIDPCGLNLTINVGKYSFFYDIVKEYENEITNIKKSIIEYKNKLLFGYIIAEKALEDFNELKQNLINYTSNLQLFLTEYYEIVDNSENKELLKQDIKQSYDLINEIKQNIIKFNESENVQFVRDIVSLYSERLKPLFIKIMNEKYKENFVWYNEDSNTYHLMQNKNSIQQLEFNEGDQEVVQFRVGYNAPKAKAKDTNNNNNHQEAVFNNENSNKKNSEGIEQVSVESNIKPAPPKQLLKIKKKVVLKEATSTPTTEGGSYEKIVFEGGDSENDNGNDNDNENDNENSNGNDIDFEQL